MKLNMNQSEQRLRRNLAVAVKPSQDIYIIGLGASAGGQSALEEFFEHIPADFPAAFVVLTHIPRAYHSELPSILARHTALSVTRMMAQEFPERGHIYVLPENAKATVNHGKLFVAPRQEDEIINTVVDDFFCSLAMDQRDRAIGVIFSGMGSDGAKGALTIHNHGGIVLVQDPSSTDFKYMPTAAIELDHPAAILAPASLVEKIVEIVNSRIDKSNQ
jgi:two-component system chemotaxis response regulator CheB